LLQPLVAKQAVTQTPDGEIAAAAAGAGVPAAAATAGGLLQLLPVLLQLLLPWMQFTAAA
jgi:hypothetical protein